MGQDDRQAQRFLESIDLLEAGAIEPQAVLELGRAYPAAVVSALHHGHGCLRRDLFVGPAPPVFLGLACQAMGLSRFLRAELPTVHPAVLSRFVSSLLYPEPTAEQICDADLQHIKQRFGTGDTRVAWRVNFILASRSTAEAPQRRRAG